MGIDVLGHATQLALEIVAVSDEETAGLFAEIGERILRVGADGFLAAVPGGGPTRWLSCWLCVEFADCLSSELAPAFWE
jgi:hypothetical protein